MCSWCTAAVSIVIVCGSHLSKPRGTSFVWNCSGAKGAGYVTTFCMHPVCAVVMKTLHSWNPGPRLCIKFKTYSLETSTKKIALLFQFCKYEKTWRRVVCGYMRGLWTCLQELKCVYIFIPVQLLEDCPYSIKHVYAFEGAVQMFTLYRCTSKGCLYRCNPALKQDMQTIYCWLIVLS